MIKELNWDSGLIKRKIGRLTIRLENLSSLKKGLKLAEAEGFQYLLCRLASQDTKVIRALESEGFYLTDIGVTFGIETTGFLTRNINRGRKIADIITTATEKDIPGLKKLIPSLFPESRFYHDPFYSKEEADNLYRAWIENSVKGQEADIVFHVPRTGFITCKKTGKHSGKIVLIGIRKSMRGKGYGSALLFRAMEWFAGQGTDFVTVRTQLKNLEGMNFYLSFGFFMKEYDLMFGKMIGVKCNRAKRVISRYDNKPKRR
ncbi:MAG: GNAT family N-acetyltransferase [Thermodesulfovibrionales bacterium]|jgi:GNAT superfamily N-acetyltransferase